MSDREMESSTSADHFRYTLRGFWVSNSECSLSSRERADTEEVAYCPVAVVFPAERECLSDSARKISCVGVPSPGVERESEVGGKKGRRRVLARRRRWIVSSHL